MWLSVDFLFLQFCPPCLQLKPGKNYHELAWIAKRYFTELHTYSSTQCSTFYSNHLIFVSYQHADSFATFPHNGLSVIVWRGSLSVYVLYFILPLRPPGGTVHFIFIVIFEKYLSLFAFYGTHMCESSDRILAQILILYFLVNIHSRKFITTDCVPRFWGWSAVHPKSCCNKLSCGKTDGLYKLL